MRDYFVRLYKSAIGKNLFANFYGVGVNLFNQILLVPFYLSFWGVEKYGDWIVLTAISTMFTMSDIGLNTVTANRFIIKFTEGNKQECTSLLTNNFILLLFTALIAIGGVIVFSFSFDIVKVIGLHVTGMNTARYVFILLTVQIFIGMFSAVINAVYRANSMTSKATFLDNSGRLLEALILFFGLLMKISLEVIVTFYLLPRLIILVYKQIDTKQLFPYIFRFSDFNFNLFKKILFPSLTFMSFPVGNAVISQGFTLVVNKAFGANDLVLYNTTRTLTNFVKTMMGTILSAVWPEYTIAYGKGDYFKVQKIHRVSVVSSTLLALIISLALLVFGRYIYTIWTNGSIQFDFNLMSAFLLVLIVNNLWYTSSVTMMATNNHSKLGIFYMISSFISLLLAYYLIPIWDSLIVTALSLLVVDAVLSAYTIRNSLLLTQDSFSQIIKSLKNIKLKQIF